MTPFGRWPAAALVALASCGLREPIPATSAHDARFGRLAGDRELPAAPTLCRHWADQIVPRDEWAGTHVSFPETDAESACFTPVVHEGRKVRAVAAPRGCTYPDETSRRNLLVLADDLEAHATEGNHHLVSCALTPAQRSAALRHDARVLRALAGRRETFPYAAVVVPGHGRADQRDTAIATFLPGDGCRALRDGDLRRLGWMPSRGARAGDALHGHVAPIAIASGGAVHSSVVEAFALMFLLQCREGIPAENILVEPCADHTHTNLRNSGRWIVAMKARAAYLVTDDGIQSDYFQDFNGFEFLLGSVDQRSLRDWGYLVGSWRQASVGIRAGFWFTPYRFWAEPRDELGSLTCVDGP